MKFKVSLVAAIILVLFGGIYGLAGINTIEPGEVGLVVKNIGSDKGVQAHTLNTGMHWYDPFINDVIVYDTRLKQYTMDDVPAGTQDGQPITVDVSFEIGLLDSGVPALHETIGSDYFDQVVYPAARSAIRTASANKLSDEVYTGIGRAAMQEELTDGLQARLSASGIRINANLRDITFLNRDFVNTLEEKAKAAQQEEIQRRYAAAAREKAIATQNTAEGEKFKVEQQAEAEKIRLQLQGEGQRLQQEEIAKGILAVGLAEAEVTKQKRAALAGAGGAELVSIAWAENLGPNVKVYGFPTGSPGTSSIMDLNGIMKGALTGAQ